MRTEQETKDTIAQLQADLFIVSRKFVGMPITEELAKQVAHEMRLVVNRNIPESIGKINLIAVPNASGEDFDMESKNLYTGIIQVGKHIPPADLSDTEEYWRKDTTVYLFVNDSFFALELDNA